MTRFTNGLFLSSMNPWRLGQGGGLVCKDKLSIMAAGGIILRLLHLSMNIERLQFYFENIQNKFIAHLAGNMELSKSIYQ